jgi:hypothetical protein
VSRFSHYCRQISKSKEWRQRKAAYWATEIDPATGRKRVRQCRACWAKPRKRWWGWQNTIDLHHLGHRWPLGSEPDDGLLPLCRTCHDVVHERLRKYRRELTDEEIRKISLRVMYDIRRHTERSQKLRSGAKRMFGLAAFSSRRDRLRS